MATIYSKTVTAMGTDKVLILESREALQIPFNIGDDWTEARLGFMISYTTVEDPNAAMGSIAESQDGALPSTSLFIGIKDSSTILPWTAGSQFWGLHNNGAVPAGSGDHFAISKNSVAMDGTTRAASANASNIWIRPANSNGLTNYVGYFGLKFNIANRGLATQTIEIRQQAALTIHNDSRLAYLRTRMATDAYSTQLPPSAWNNGSSAKNIPTTIYLYSPFVSIRPRIHSVCIEKYA